MVDNGAVAVYVRGAPLWAVPFNANSGGLSHRSYAGSPDAVPLRRRAVWPICTNR